MSTSLRLEARVDNQKINIIAFIGLTLSVGHQEKHPAGNKNE